MPLEQITDHLERSLKLLAEQFRNSSTHRALLAAFAGEVQELEDTLFSLIAGRALPTCTGEQLDRLALIVGETRDGDEDLAFRLRIGSRILINRRSGEIETIIGVFAPLLNGGTVRVDEYEPAAFVATLTGATSSQIPTFARLLRLAKAAGVRAQLVYSLSPAADTFTLDGTPDQSLDAGLLAGVAE